MKALGPKDSALYENLSIIPVNTVEEMAERVKSCTDLEITKEGRKRHKEIKKEVHERKRSEQRRLRQGTSTSVTPYYNTEGDKYMRLLPPKDRKFL